jgi:hypothetical protein
MTYQQPQNPFPPPGNVEPNFFAALFDLSFTTWVTLRIAGILYILTVVLVGLGLLFSSIAIAGDIGGFPGFLVFIIGFPLAFFLVTLALRLAFEGAVATVAIAKNTESLTRR